MAHRSGEETSIRRATAGDIEPILGLSHALYLEDGDAPFVRPSAEEALRSLLADESLGLVWVGEESGAVIGYLVLTWGFSLEYHGRDAFVDEAFVAAPHRGRGLGTRMLEAAAEACRARGVRALHLEVERANEGARRLYRRFGFGEHGRLLMTKRLEDGARTEGTGGA